MLNLITIVTNLSTVEFDDRPNLANKNDGFTTQVRGKHGRPQADEGHFGVENRIKICWAHIYVKWAYRDLRTQQNPRFARVDGN